MECKDGSICKWNENEPGLIENIVECKVGKNDVNKQQGFRLIENIVECKGENRPEAIRAFPINRKHSGM